MSSPKITRIFGFLACPYEACGRRKTSESSDIKMTIAEDMDFSEFQQCPCKILDSIILPQKRQLILGTTLGRSVTGVVARLFVSSTCHSCDRRLLFSIADESSMDRSE